MVIMTKELFLNGELILNRKDTHGKRKHTKREPVFTSKMEKREYDKNGHHFDIRNVLDLNGYFKDMSENWHTYVSQVNLWIQKSTIKKLVVTGIFTVVLGLFASTSNAAFIQEYTYQVKNNEKIENIAKEHGVTTQEILDANGVSSIKGKKILLPKVEDRVVTATILNIRSRPNTESSILGKYKKGDVVKVAFVENDWAGILINGRVCYVNTDYLTEKQVSASATAKINAKTETINNKTNIDSTVYVIKQGDTFTKIAKSFGISVTSIQKLNPTIDPTMLKIGQTINIAPSVSSKNNNNKTSSSEYVIKSGDTFTKIGREFGVSVSSIQEFNPNIDPTKLKIGQRIKIATTTTSNMNHLNVAAQIVEADHRGVFQFITSNGNTFSAKASGDLLHEVFELQGEKVILTLEGKRGQQMNLITLH